MEDAREDRMDLDLNLGPNDPVSPGLEERIRRLEAVALRPRYRWRWRSDRVSPEPRNISMEMILNSGRERRLHTGEGSVAAEERTTERSKKCKGNSADLIAKAFEKDDKEEKGSDDGTGFFDCNICLDMARNPVLTGCGHLFCWPCLYQWLHIHSDAKECPVCKGEVTDANITPIYGRGGNTHESEKEDESGVKVPPRPHARRIESLRQSIHRTVQVDEFSVAHIIRQIGNRFDPIGEWPPSRDIDGSRETTDGPSSLANRIHTTRRMRREGSGRFSLLERSRIRREADIMDFMQRSTGSSEAEGSRRLPSRRLLRSQPPRATSGSYLSSALNTDERLAQAYLGHPMRRNHNQFPPVEDTGSASSMAADIHSESQTMDNAMEIDSMLSLSPSSRRSIDALRASDADIRVSPATRRRRLN